MDLSAIVEPHRGIGSHPLRHRSGAPGGSGEDPRSELPAAETLGESALEDPLTITRQGVVQELMK
jgi:hypothetical protein